MLSQGDTFQKTHHAVSDDSASTQHRIQFANSVLLITRPEIAGSRHSVTIIDTAPRSNEPVFTRETTRKAIA